jgi:hypothetical protein
MNALKFKIAAKISKEHHNNFKTTSGSQSGLDASIQAKQQAEKSHATVPLSTGHNIQRVKGQMCR